MLLKIARLIYSIYALLLFVTIMLLIFPFVLIALLFGGMTGGNLIFRLCMLWADTWFPLVLIFPRRIFISPHDPAKSYIFVCNHSSLLDAALVPKAFRQVVRALGKEEIARIPVFGFIYRKAIVTVDRSDETSRSRSIAELVKVLRKHVSVLFFPEGTYNTTGDPLKTFYNGAFRIAIETQTPIKPVLFPDARDRMRLQDVFSLNPGRCRIVFLDEITVQGLTLENIDELKEKVFTIMAEKLVELRRIAAADHPI